MAYTGITTVIVVNDDMLRDCPHCHNRCLKTRQYCDRCGFWLWPLHEHDGYARSGGLSLFHH